MGKIFALLCSLIWGLAVICFKKSGERISPFSLTFFRVGITSILLVITAKVAGYDIFNAAPLKDYLILFASGIIAIAISDTMFHHALNRIGAGMMAVVDCFYSPSVILFAFLLLNETIGVWQFVGMFLVLCAILIVSRHKPQEGISRKDLLVGILWGIGAMLTLGFGVVLAKTVLEDSPLIWATAMRQVGSLFALVPVALISKRRRKIFSVFKPTSDWKYSLTGTLLGSYLALIFWLGGMKYTKAGTAAILNQTSTIYVIIFASIFLHEPFTRKKAVSVLLALGGIALVTLG
ncbi:MAG: EamA family transporter [Candidatus Latescibacteria bacterium]|nr:EamA family transporter [bacterium]MBD3422985.1 EamA family transporter [Candidatus Latescibacterota bacterium]